MNGKKKKFKKKKKKKYKLKIGKIIKELNRCQKIHLSIISNFYFFKIRERWTVWFAIPMNYDIATYVEIYGN